MQSASEVEVEYVSAPHEYEELLQSEPEAAPAETAGLGSSGGGLGFVSAGASVSDSGVSHLSRCHCRGSHSTSSAVGNSPYLKMLRMPL